MPNKTMTPNQPAECGISRRDFLKLTSVAGGAAAFLGSLPHAQKALAKGDYSAYPLAEPENILYSVCQQCNTQCGRKSVV